MEYIRVVDSTLVNSKLLSASINPLDIKRSFPDATYMSMYRFNEEHAKQYNISGSVAGISDVTTPYLWWDFDVKDDVTEAKKSTGILIDRLIRTGLTEDSIQVKFSGSKGFHVVVKTDKTMTPREVNSICTKLAGDLKGFDSVVYNATRILRLPLVLHKKTQLYSRLFKVSDFKEYSTDEIINLSGNVSDINIDRAKAYYSVAKLPDLVYNYKDLKPEVKVEIQTDLKVDIKDLNFENKPPFLDNARYALYKGYFSEGERSNALLCLASTYRNLGFEMGDTYRLLKSALEKHEFRLGKENIKEQIDKEYIWNNIIKQVYGPSWRGGQFSVQDPTSWLYTYAKRNNINATENANAPRIVSAEEGFSGFLEYAKKIDENTIKFGIHELDSKLKAQVGHLIGILAPPSSGKTSFMLTVLNNTSNMNMHSMFFSYDMHQSILFQKLVQRETGLESDDIFEAAKNGDTAKIQDFFDKVRTNYKNVSFVFKSGQTIAEIKRTIIERELMLGVKIPLIGIDYSELVLSQFSDSTQASMEVIQGLREIANEMNKCVIVLLQPNKISSKPTEPLLNYNCAKGSSAIAQAVTSMITCHRPGIDPIDPRYDNYFSINCVKNRMGPLFSVDFHWKGLTGKIRELTVAEKQDLFMLRKRLEEKSTDDGSW